LSVAGCNCKFADDFAVFLYQLDLK